MIAGVDASELRAARRLWTSGVAVVCVRQDDGWRGATVASFTVVSLEPPLVMVCLESRSTVAALAGANGAFTVSLLTPDHEFPAERFAGRAPLVNAAFAGVPYDLAPSGLPVLTGAIAWFDCVVDAVHPGGDHLIIVGLVVAVSTDPDQEPLMYFDGQYRALSPK